MKVRDTRERESANQHVSLISGLFLGDLLAEIETDKATMGFETPEEGYLAKILFGAGSKDIPVGKLLCIIVENEADLAAFKDFKDDGAGAAKPAAAAPAPSAPAPAAAAPSPPPAASRPSGAVTASEQKYGDRVLASPMARRLAETQKLRLEGSGSGLYGSLTSKDLGGMGAAGAPQVSAQAPIMPAGAAYIDIPVSNVRGVIAKRLLESKVSIPHYYLTVDCNVDKILELRAKFNKSLEKSGKKLSINDFIIKAVATACRKVPECNSAWLGNTIRQ
jgi:pyruvate dehydrogenase E2 component (dihydrolipoamide acetyltransferase)